MAIKIKIAGKKNVQDIFFEKILFIAEMKNKNIAIFL